MTATVHGEVLAANDAFYEAFEAGTMAAMAELWEHSDEVICTHPGIPTLRGWDEVRLSWEQLLRQDGGLQFIVTDERVVVYGAVGWVTCTENIIGPDGASGTVSAINLFVRSTDGEWLMVGHHGGGVAPQR
ncbi:MAG: nuclear transport factor 2 family protein [Acidimicrobiia bacterium]